MDSDIIGWKRLNLQKVLILTEQNYTEIIIFIGILP